MLRTILVIARLLLAAPIAILGGCSAAEFTDKFGSSAPPPPADPKVYPSHYREQIAEFMRTYLPNPTKIRDASISEPVMRPVAGVPHYISCVRYNPRDADNRYEGLQTRQATFLTGNLIQFLAPEGDSCNGVAYQRYPAIESLVP